MYDNSNRVSQLTFVFMCEYLCVEQKLGARAHKTASYSSRLQHSSLAVGLYDRIAPIETATHIFVSHIEDFPPKKYPPNSELHNFRFDETTRFVLFCIYYFFFF